MAETIIKIKVDAGKDELYVFDTTGIYSATNQEGWGNPNTLVTDAISAEVRVYLPKSDTYISVDVFSSLPNTDNVGFEINALDLGLSLLDPGVYKLQYIVVTTSGSTLVSNLTSFFHYLPIECCISSKKLALSPGDVCSDAVKDMLEAELLLENSIWAACSGDEDTAQSISDDLWLKCNCC